VQVIDENCQRHASEVSVARRRIHGVDERLDGLKASVPVHTVEEVVQFLGTRLIQAVE
jgi:hypothetical protein